MTHKSVKVVLCVYRYCRYFIALECVRNILVYDFQESPTGELADYTFSTESSGQESPEEKNSDHQLQPEPELETQTCETFCVAEETDGNNSEEGEFANDIRCYAE